MADGERTKGKVEEIKGSMKEGFGDLIGNEDLEAEGRAEKIHGQTRQEIAKAEAQVKGASEELSGKVQGAVGELIGNEQMEVEGKVKELKGKGRQQASK